MSVLLTGCLLLSVMPATAFATEDTTVAAEDKDTIAEKTQMSEQESTPGENRTEESVTDESKADESKADESIKDESKTGECSTEESSAEEGNSGESKIEEDITDESTVKDGYSFSEDTAMTVNGENVQSGLSGNFLYAPVVKTIAMPTVIGIDVVEINDVTVRFKDGDKPVFTGKTPEGVHYRFRCEWWELDTRSDLYRRDWKGYSGFQWNTCP